MVWCNAVMHWGWLTRLMSSRRGIAAALALSLLLPALIGLLPQPALSASAALDRDIALSQCNPSGASKEQGAPQHEAGHDHCILCGTSCPGGSPTLSSGGVAFTAAPEPSAVHLSLTAEALPRPHLALRDASPPRGPPTFS